MTARPVAPGIHLVQHANVNCYLIEDTDGLTLVDAGLPAVWRPLGHAVRALGRRPEDIKALVLTHAHFDHVGAARRLVERLGVPVYAHRAEHYLAAHPYSYAHENPRALYPLRHPAALPILGSMVAAGVFTVKGVRATAELTPGETVPVPGRPVVVPSPGHTHGHCALHLPGPGRPHLRRRPRHPGPLHRPPRPAHHRRGRDRRQRPRPALAGRPRRDGAGTVLPGHGEPWHSGVESAVEEARRHGPA